MDLKSKVKAPIPTVATASLRSKITRRQVSVPSQKTTANGIRRKSQSEIESLPASSLTNGTTKAASGSLSHRCPGRDSTRKLPAESKAEKGSSHENESSAQVSDSKKKSFFGKGRLERGKQISHLGLFPHSDSKHIQRQSTSMQAEAGDHPADLEELSSPNPAVERKLSGQWRKQVDQISEALMNYGETHPQFSSVLSACRLGKMAGLKTLKSLQGDQLTISVTFDVNPTIFDFRAPNSKSFMSNNRPSPLGLNGERESVEDASDFNDKSQECVSRDNSTDTKD